MEEWFTFLGMVGGGVIAVVSFYVFMETFRHPKLGIEIFAMVTFFLGAVLLGFSGGWGSARETDSHELLNRLGEHEELALVAVVNANDFCVVLSGEKDLFCVESKHVLNLAEYGSGQGLNSIKAKPGDWFYVSDDFSGKNIILYWVRR